MSETPSPETLARARALAEYIVAWLEGPELEADAETRMLDDELVKYVAQDLATIEQPLQLQRELERQIDALRESRARVEQLERVLRMARRAIDNYFSYSPSRRDEMALGAVDTAMRSIKAALSSAGEATAQRCDHKLVESNRCLKCGQVLARYGLTD
jgi:serine phosphatase RsbU (regulator of sigma subunit)